MTRPERISFPGTFDDAARLELVLRPLGAKVVGADFPEAPETERIGVVVVPLPADAEQAEKVRQAVDQWRQQNGR
jgi:hypothetical protein